MTSEQLSESYTSEKPLEIIDKLFPFLPDNGHFEFLYYGKTYLNWTIAEILYFNATKELIYHKAIVDFNYIEKIELTENYKFTSVGQLAKSMGGHYKYQQYLKNEKELKLKNERLTFKKLEFDVKNAKRIYDTYYWTFGLSIAAFIISLALAILKLIEWLN